ncbi:hypothetical protein [Nocardia abscessus]|uniref:hypothetical protein n=1 Tax=Nocardia abscessus TaxID=120957 RepID=UPI00245564F1|nr:hypothetical protein [Nocardia abscessus]
MNSGIAESIAAPARGAGKPIVDPTATPPSAIANRHGGRNLPRPAATGRALARTGELVGPQQRNRLPGARLRSGAEMPIRLPEVVEHVRANPFGFDSDPDTPVCSGHYAQLRGALAGASPGYSIDLRWRNPQDNRRERRIKYPA